YLLGGPPLQLGLAGRADRLAEQEQVGDRGGVLRGDDVGLVGEEAAVLLERGQVGVLAVGDVQQGDRGLERPGARAYGRVEVLAQPQVRTGEDEVAQRAVGQVEAAGVAVEPGPDRGQVPGDRLTRRRRQGGELPRGP